MKIGAGAGHGGNDPGAVSSGNVEVTLNRLMNSTMVSAGKGRGQTMIDVTIEKGYPNNINEPVSLCNGNKVDLAIQNHFNAGGGTGVEVLYYAGNSTAKAMATKISTAIASAYGITNRGAKSRTNLGFLNNTLMSALIIEWGFVDAPGNSDVPKIIADPLRGVSAVFDALGIVKIETGQPVEPTGTLVKGDSGDGVRWVQSMLKAHGYDLEVDGDFGPLTETAVRDLQGQWQLDIDGIVGPKTRKFLMNIPASSAEKEQADPSKYFVQAGAFGQKENADALIKRLKEAGFDAIIKIG